MVDKVLQNRMLSDLKKSGLSQVDAKKLMYKPIDAKALSELVERPVGPGYEIPYADFKGKFTSFSRYKLFDSLILKTYEMRYWQPPKSPPKLYIPTLIDWEKVLDDQELEVWITEGEKKAAALSALGVPCLAVSGVWAWQSKRLHQHLVPELKALCPRPFVLCFDSDVDENVSVKGALSALAITIERLGSTIRVCTLPTFKRGAKVGLDDFLVHYKKLALQRLTELEKEPLGLSVALQALNTELMVVEEQQSVFHLKTHKFATPQVLTTVVMADRLITTYDRAGQPKQLNAAAEWLKWPQRRIVPALTYAPGLTTTLDDGAHNLWKGWGIEPKKGETKLFDELVDYLGADLSEEERAWWLQWMACPLQRPGVKQYSATLVYSHHQGTGKTLLGYTLGRIYGENYVEVDQEKLHSPFNNWARCRQLIVGDEITGSDKRQDADRLKHMITREKLSINEKYQPAYELPDTCNYYLTTNQPDAVYIEKTDRRYFIVEVKTQPLPKSFYKSYDKWYRSDAGAAAVFYKLLHHIDLDGFDHQAQPPLTSAKAAMHEATGTEVDIIVRDLVRDPKQTLATMSWAEGCELFTLQQLQTLLDPTGRIGRVQIGKALRRLGAPQPFVTGVVGGAKALYAIASFDRWAGSTHHERKEHYNLHNIASKEPKESKIADPVAKAKRDLAAAKQAVDEAIKKAAAVTKKGAKKK
jgi:hypothetical protein